MKLDDLKHRLLDMQKQADVEKLEMDISLMFDAFCHQYNTVNGDCALYISKPNYLSLMDERDKYCLEQIAQVMESKKKYLYEYNG